MALVEVAVVQDRLVLVARSGVVDDANGQVFVGMTQSEAHDLITKLCTGVEQAQGWREAQADQKPVTERCERCKRTKGPRHRCVGLSKAK